MTSDTRELVAAAGRCLEAAWRDGFAYAKAGVLLDDLLATEAAPPCLLGAPRPGSAAPMAAVTRASGGARCSPRRWGSSGRGRSG
jgi:DNA polymerase V